MRRLAYVAVMTLCLCGCKPKMVSVPVDDTQNKQASASVPESKLTDAQKITLLRVEAHKRGLAWEIFCTRFLVKDPEGFQADAWNAKEGDFNAVAGHKIASWAEAGATQADAAYALYQAIQNIPPRGPKTPEERKGSESYDCPLPELHSN